MRQAAEGRTVSHSAPTVRDDEPSADDRLSSADSVAIGQWGEEYIFPQLCAKLKSQYLDATIDRSKGEL
jgi:hypothetical protein